MGKNRPRVAYHRKHGAVKHGVDIVMLNAIGNPALSSRIDRINTGFRLWMRSLPKDIGQFVAGTLAGYEPAEIAVMRNWSAEHLAEVQIQAEVVAGERIKDHPTR